MSGTWFCLSVLSYPGFFLLCYTTGIVFLLRIGTSHFVVYSVCSLFWFSCQYLPSDWLERLLWGHLFESRSLCPQRPGRRVLLCVFRFSVLFYCYAPALGGIKRWCCLSVSCLSLTSGRRLVYAAGWLDGAYWLIWPGSAGLAQGCRCALPLQAWAGACRGGRPPTACCIVCLSLSLHNVFIHSLHQYYYI